MSGVMFPFHVEFQSGTQVNSRLVWAEDAWDALHIAHDATQVGSPLRATRLIPYRIFEYDLKERRA